MNSPLQAIEKFLAHATAATSGSGSFSVADATLQ
jgi:hypothetical protein